MQDLSLAFALMAGALSFLSPCVLPLVPGYVSFVSGVAYEEIDQPGAQRRVILSSLAFILGFSLVFIAFGATATALGQMLSANQRWLTQVAGLLVVVFGLHTTGLITIPLLYREGRVHLSERPPQWWAPLLIGAAFAFGWTPCVGPILAGILTLASGQETVWQGVVLLSVYSLGLGIPFLLVAWGLSRFYSFFDAIKPHMGKINVASGVLLVVIGLLIATDQFTWLAGKLNFLPTF